MKAKPVFSLLAENYEVDSCKNSKTLKKQAEAGTISILFFYGKASFERRVNTITKTAK